MLIGTQPMKRLPYPVTGQMSLHRNLRASLTCVVVALLAACGPQGLHQPVSASLQVSSTTLISGTIPDRSTCKGPGVSPQLSWTDPPPGTQSFALIMDDQDAPMGRWRRHFYVHWLAFNVPADQRALAEGQPRQSTPNGIQQGENDAREFGYSVPCPQVGSTHHYAISVYALDSKLDLPVTTQAGPLLAAIDGHVLARGQILGTYTH